MMNIEDNPKFWENIYKNDDAGWDLGGPTPVFEKISSIIKPKKICIIGCGRGYDAVMFAKNNFDENDSVQRGYLPSHVGGNAKG